MNVYYMTSLCPDVDIDRKILRSVVRIDRELLNLVLIVCSDVDIDLTMSHPCQTRVLCDDRFSRPNWETESDSTITTGGNNSVEKTWLARTETRHDFLAHGDLLRASLYGRQG